MMTKISISLALKIIMAMVLLVHAFYLVIFYVMHEEILATTNIFSIVIYSSYFRSKCFCMRLFACWF